MTPARLPGGAIDAHVHLFDRVRFPFAARSPYEPAPSESGNEADLRAVLDAHGVAGALLVNPTSAYGDDNACMLAALQSGQGRFRGIARLPLQADRRHLRKLAAAGVAGVRRDLTDEGVAQLADPRLARLAATMADLDLVMQLHFRAEQVAAVRESLNRLPCRIVIDHCGRPDAQAGWRSPHFDSLLALADVPRVAVKLSGGFRFGVDRPGYEDADCFAQALLARFGPERCLWGSDWPFVRMPHRIDYGTSLAMFFRWVPDARTRARILVDSPRRWFGFPEWAESPIGQGRRPQPGVRAKRSEGGSLRD